MAMFCMVGHELSLWWRGPWTAGNEFGRTGFSVSGVLLESWVKWFLLITSEGYPWPFFGCVIKETVPPCAFFPLSIKNLWIRSGSTLRSWEWKWTRLLWALVVHCCSTCLRTVHLFNPSYTPLFDSLEILLLLSHTQTCKLTFKK